MRRIYRLHTSELTEDLLNSIKEAFEGKAVEIVVSDEIKDSDAEIIRSYTTDEDSFKFWMAEEEDLYQDNTKKKSE